MKFFLSVLATAVLLSISWPTYGIPIFLFIAFVPLLNELTTMVDTRCFSYLKVFGLSYINFFIWNAVTTWWIYNSTGFGMWVALLFNSLFMSLICGAYVWYYAKTKNLKKSLIFFTVLWVAFEYNHHHWQISWPWLTLGNGFSSFPSWVQWYEYTGVFGGSLWVLIVNMLVVLVYRRIRVKQHIVWALGVFIFPLVVSLIHYYTYDITSKSFLEALILQPNQDPYKEKFFRTNAQTATLLENMVSKNISKNTSLVIAPETVFASRIPLDGIEGSIPFRTFDSLRKHYDFYSLLGVSPYKHFRDSSLKTIYSELLNNGYFLDSYNSALWVTPDHQYDLYHKSKPVVGVEHFPYRSVIEPLLGDQMIDLGGFTQTITRQDKRSVFPLHLKDEDTPVYIAPVICYESIYGEFIGKYIRNQANLIAVITNDGWWGNTQGHKQHLALSRLRAIETRKTLIRSANTGISAVINPKGDILESLEYGKKGVILTQVGTNSVVTFYSKSGDYLAKLCCFILACMLLLVLTKRRSEVGIF